MPLKYWLTWIFFKSWRNYLFFRIQGGKALDKNHKVANNLETMLYILLTERWEKKFSRSQSKLKANLKPRPGLLTLSSKPFWSPTLTPLKCEEPKERSKRMIYWETGKIRWMMENVAWDEKSESRKWKDSFLIYRCFTLFNIWYLWFNGGLAHRTEKQKIMKI